MTVFCQVSLFREHSMPITHESAKIQKRCPENRV